MVNNIVGLILDSIMRVFIAMEVKDSNTIDKISNIQDVLARKMDVKLVRKEQLHFTLLFLGEISNLMLERIKDRLKDLRFNAIEVTYKGLGAFPNARNARVIWIGVDDNSASKLARIAYAIEERLNPLGFKSDKGFKPHITIARARARVDCSSIINDDIFGYDRLDEIKIKKSILTQSGPIYSDLFTIKAG